ncbi:PHB depolymerase family esterase [Denitratimonas sp. CY0512]|uniref:extracellular catalytic domain type 2 short-chain-length polyhydroxyalkanoate depolymerase n=1 Tax=Denitratimonas sp. CY0512 TaxID=3131940 RepID=UPI0030A4A476
MKRHSSKPVAVLALLALATPLLGGCGTQAAESALPALNLDPERVSVVGLSSGAAMAQQAHFAWSDRLIGAGLIAGPPYGCAEGDLGTALGRCMKGEPDAPDPVRLAERARELAESGRIAPLSGLDGDRVYVLHGKADSTVAAGVTRASYSIYEALAREVASPPVQLETMVWDAERDIAHAWPTLDQGGTCNVTEAPFIGACDFDASGEMLAALYGPAPAAATAVVGKVHTFDQNAYRSEGTDAFLAQEGFLYVPEQCAAGKPCGAVIAFHGCEQNAAMLGDRFIVGNGLNRWADAYDLVVVYPQTRASFMPLNPKACWDWWGYSGPDYDTRDGVQMRWLANLTAALGIPLQP